MKALMKAGQQSGALSQMRQIIAQMMRGELGLRVQVSNPYPNPNPNPNPNTNPNPNPTPNPNPDATKNKLRRGRFYSPYDWIRTTASSTKM